MMVEDLLQSLRGKREDATARTNMLPVPPLYPVAPEAELAAAERRTGLSLPPLLRRVYAEVGNGGFGPGAGMLGVTGGHPDADGRCLPERYESLRAEGWPPDLLPLWDWGDASWSCVDVATAEATIVTMDGFGRTKTRFTLASWLEQWVLGTDLFGELYEFGTATGINPFTRKPMPMRYLARPKGTPE